ncbi:MAG: DUF4397 domain-containing protein [Chloroflexaceae bacterium]
MRRIVLVRIALVMAIVLSTALFAVTRSTVSFAQAAEPEQATPARVALVHAAPFAAGSATVSVFLDNLLIDDSFAFGDVITYLSVPPDTYRVRVFVGSFSSLPTGVTPVLDVSGVTVNADTDYTLVAIGGSNDFPLELLTLVDRTPGTPPPASAEGQVRVVHAAPFARGLPATAVDVVPDAGGSAIASNVRYRDSTPFNTLPSGTPIDVEVRFAGTSLVLIDPDAFTLTPQQRLSVFAIGDGTNQPLRALVVPAEAERAQVRLVHAAPFASGTATATVTLNNAVVTNALNFGQITPYSAVTAGVYQVRIYAGTSATGTPVFDSLVVFLPNTNYTAVAIGRNTATYPINVLLLTDDPTQPRPGQARLRIVHAAPFASTVDGNQVHIVSTTGGPPLVTGLDYAEVTGYLTVPAATPFNLRLVSALSPATTILDLPPLTFNDGRVVTAVAVGDTQNQQPDLLLLDDLTRPQIRVFLPFVAS